MMDLKTVSTKASRMVEYLGILLELLMAAWTEALLALTQVGALAVLKAMRMAGAKVQTSAELMAL